jgi:hypothetical protein
MPSHQRDCTAGSTILFHPRSYSRAVPIIGRLLAGWRCWRMDTASATAGAARHSRDYWLNGLAGGQRRRWSNCGKRTTRPRDRSGAGRRVSLMHGTWMPRYIVRGAQARLVCSYTHSVCGILVFLASGGLERGNL